MSLVSQMGNEDGHDVAVTAIWGIKCPRIQSFSAFEAWPSPLGKLES